MVDQLVDFATELNLIAPPPARGRKRIADDPRIVTDRIEPYRPPQGDKNHNKN